MTTIDALVEALEKISTGDAWHKDGVIGFAKEALALARAEQSEPVITVADDSQEWAGMSGNQAWHLIFRHADGWGDIDKMMEEWRAANTPPAAPAKPLHQALTDPENQPNQYGVEFLMHGQKMAFKVGAQQFTLDYEPTEPGEFELMRDSLIHALSTFTPDVKTAAPAKLEPLTEAEIRQCFDYAMVGNVEEHDQVTLTRVIESELNAKLGGA